MSIFFFNRYRFSLSWNRVHHHYFAETLYWPVSWPPSFCIAFSVLFFLLFHLWYITPSPMVLPGLIPPPPSPMTSPLKSNPPTLRRDSADVNSIGISVYSWVSQHFSSWFAFALLNHDWQMYSPRNPLHVAPAGALIENCFQSKSGLWNGARISPSLLHVESWTVLGRPFALSLYVVLVSK